MKRNMLVLVLVLLVSFGALASITLPHAGAVAPVCYVTSASSITPYLVTGSPVQIVNVAMHVTNDEDSGFVGYWALDNYTKTIQVWRFSNGTYAALVLYSGTWKTYAGALSPQNGVAEPLDASGVMQGGYVAKFDGTNAFIPSKPISGDIGAYAFGGTKIDVLKGTYGAPQTGSPTPTDWTSFYFNPHPPNLFTQPVWGWSYQLNTQQWCNSYSGSIGEIWTQPVATTTITSTSTVSSSSTRTTTFTATSTRTSTATSTQTLVPVTIDTNSTLVGYLITSVGVNITVTGPPGTVGHMKVTVLKTLLNGNPFIVLDDGHANFIPPTLITSNSTYWILDLYYHHSQHEIFVEGINSVPEFPAITAIALIALALSLVVIKHRKAHAK